MKYCKRCLLPNSKPYLIFSNGVCSACIFHNKKNKYRKGINWKHRKKEFIKLIEKIKKKKAPLFDALVPVSGGKDSITQVHHLLNKGLRILAVNIDYGIKTDLGVQNLNCIPDMGANLITYRPDLNLHKYVIKKSFLDYGDPDLLSHCMLHALPIRMAIDFKIPLVLLGENSAYEYSGSNKKKFNEREMTYEWFKYYAANSGITPSEFAKRYSINEKSIKMYDLPKNQELNKTNAVFCSYFFKWSSEENFKIAKKYGFKALTKSSEGTYRTYVGIDEKINRIHQYLKLIKFGYGRATDHACEDIRNSKITRNEGILLVLKHDRKNLSEKIVNDFINFINISKKQFYKTIEKNRNNRIWKLNSLNKWKIIFKPE